MLKNKKKLRRLERHTPGYAARAAQTLVLAGALVLSGAGLASAADINQTGAGDVSIDKDTTLGTADFFDVNTVIPQFKTAQAAGNYTTLTITGSSSNVSLTVDHQTTLGDITLTGADATPANTGLLVLAAGAGDANLVTGGKTTVGAFGVLQVGAVDAAGADGDAKLASLDIAADGSLLVGGNGDVNMGGNGFLVVDGSMNTAEALHVGGAGAAGTGGAGSDGGAGELAVNGNFSSTFIDPQTIGGTGGDGVAAGGVGGNAGAGTLTLNGDTNTFASALQIGGAKGATNTNAGGTGGKGILNLAGGSTTLGGDVQIGVANGATGSLNIGGNADATNAGTNATAIIKKNLTFNDVTGTLTIGGMGGAGIAATGGEGTLIIDAGSGNTSTVTGDVTVGGTGGNGINAGRGGKGNININSGTAAFAATGTLVLGGVIGNGGMGTMTVSNGAVATLLNVTTGVQIGQIVADGGDGLMTVETGGTATSAGDILVGNAAADSGTGTLMIENDGRVVVAAGKNVTIGDITATKSSMASAEMYTKGNTGTAYGLTSDVVNIGNKGIFEIRGNQTLAGDDLAASGKAVNIAVGGTLDVLGTLTLTDMAAATTPNTTSVDGMVKAQSLVTDVAATSQYSWNGGTLMLSGNGDKAASILTAAGGLTLDGGNVNLNADDATGGGTYDKKITVTDGTLTAGQGTWHVNQLDVAATTGETSITGNLVIDGAVSGDLKTLDAGNGTLGLNVDHTGTLTATATVLFENLVTDFTRNTNIKTIDLAAGGLLKIVGLADSSITLTQAGTIGGQLKTGSGLIDYGKALTAGKDDRFTTVEGLNGTVKGDLANNSGAQLKETVGYDKSADPINPTVTTGGFGAKDLLVKAATGTTTVDIDLSNSLTLLGGAQGSSLVSVVGDTDKKVLTNINVASGFGLTLGNAETLDMQGGTLNGNVELLGVAGDNNGSALTVVKGTYEVKDITGTEFDTATVTGNGLLNAANVNLGKLVINGGTLDASGAIDAVTANIKNGQILSIADSTFTGDVTLENGVIGAGDIGASTGNLAVDGSIITIAGSKNAIVSGNNITVDNFKQMMADGTTVAGISNAIIIAGKDFTVTAGGFDAKGVTLDVGGALKTTDNADVIADAKSNLTIQTLDMANTGQVTVKGASTLAVESLTLAAKTMTIGTASAADKDIKDGSMLSSVKTDLSGGLLLVQNAKASLGELTAVTGSIFVDPAYVNIDSIKGEFGASLLAGAGGHITVGGLNEAWAQQVINNSGAPADSSVLGINKSITLAANGVIVADKAVDMNGKIGSAAPITNAVYFGDKSLLALDGSQFLDGAKPAAIAGKGQAIVVQNTGDTQARLHITSVKTGDTVHVLSGVTGVDVNDSTKNAGWLNNNITFDTELFKGEGVTNAGNSIYNVNVRNVGAQLIFPKLSSGMAGLVDNVMGQYGLQTDSNHAGVRFVSRAVSNDFGLGGRNADKAAATIEGAAQLGAVAGVQMSTIGAANAASGAVITRTSFAQPLMDMSKAVAVHQDADGTLSLDSGLSAGNGMNNGLGVWIMPLYQSNKTWGQKAGNFKNGMSSDLGGIALGADYTINDMFRYGAAFNVGAGYGKSSGDFNKTDNKFNFWGVNLYGGWTMNNMGLSADVGYTSNYNKVEQEMPTSMQMGKLKSDITSSAWTAGLKGEYKIETSLMDIIPHVGVRYMGLTTDSYDVKSGGTVFGVKKDFQSVWTFPVGVAFSKSYTTDSGPSAWTFKPQVDLSVIPAAGDINAKSKAHIPGVMGNAEMKMQVVDAITYDAGLGIEMGKDNLSFGVNYNIQASEHRTGHGVFGTLRYEF